MRLNELLANPEDRKVYEFLKTNENLGSNIMFLTYGGSHAYGTNVEGSDIDIRGVMQNSTRSLLGFENFEHYVDKNTDTTIYGFNKFIQLAAKCNPNVIELLGCTEYAYVSSLGQEILDNSQIFLSQQASASFGGYAMSQMRRFKNILTRGIEDLAEKENHIKITLEDYLVSLEGRHKDFNADNVSFFMKEGADGLPKVHCNFTASDIPVHELSSIMNELTNITENINKLGHHNNKKDDLHINKHAMHLVRLYLMAIDLLKDCEIKTYRENDRDLLLSIRNGYYQQENGLYKPEFFKMLDDYKEKFEDAKAKTPLPKKADMVKIEEFTMNINRKILEKEGVFDW